MAKKSTIHKLSSVLIKKVQKRNGEIVPFDIDRIVNAINKAMIATGEGSLEEAEMVANKVYADLVRISKKHPNFLPTVEGVQNSVEKELMLSEYITTAKAYILYREKRSSIRYKGIEVPEKVRKLANESKKYFRNPLGEFVYYRTYSRWIEEENRREEEKKEKKKEKTNGSLVDLPGWLNKPAWEEWIEFRKEIKKPLTTLGAKKCLAVLEAHQAQQKEIIDTSIARGWTGLFPPKEAKASGNKPPREFPR